ncbi:glycerophosphocholine phosphodiesterase GPCPD1 [Diabrotica virgifera virgifera]|uniref:Glycerophosphocholine phosphodiesterase GPCPD1 n=1 Tax=Diabrotica virgifera virgifera TaxID=50390 RepID=A0A6P7EX69_DIAVI|nr:glycerophosphocholine phosphodiesterase GPCPD1 [Diabrotica virgifera virgifera]XP_028127734.1 glycerophosphocholine phosphodiesterase GPCPD1 [Diabrotica virgifera virgifera]
MQRWFFLEDPSSSEIRNGKPETRVSSTSLKSAEYTPKKWLFRVRVPEVLRGDEHVCVCGDLPELGSWQPEKCVPLIREEDSDIWSAIIEIPEKKKVEFRYCVCILVELGIQVIVRSWETNLQARSVDSISGNSPTLDEEPHEYGCYGDSEHIDRGWLSKETVIQLKLCNNPLVLFRPKYQNRNINIKVTPVNLTRSNTGFAKTMSEALEESLSADTQDSVEAPRHAFTEVASLNAEDPSFHPQNQFGNELIKDDMLIFQSTVLFPSTIAFLIDLYIYSSRSGEGEPPYHAGFSYLLPSVLQGSEGNYVLPVTSTKHRPLGEIRIGYLVIGPMPNFKCDMFISYARHWKKTRSGLDVGHRGSGSSFKTKVQNCAEVRENTIASLKNAIEHGADFVEFDVQLSKDLVPIIYHDFHVCISMKRKKELAETDMLEIPLKELTLDQLRLLKVYHLTEGKSKNQRFFDEELDDHQPFPTLQQCLETLDSHTGFNIEIKWTMQLNDGSYELYHPTDLNLYLDTILDVVLRYGGDRRIIFSCFNPDICQVIRLKQNKYPVMFLTVGESQIHAKYRDPRCWSIPAAAQYAKMIEILGINVHTEDLLRDSSLVKHGAGLILFCWGDQNADPATIKFLKQLGLHGVIYDKIHEYNNTDKKESIFMVEARESQKELIRLAAATSEAPQSPPPQAIIKEPVLDFHMVKGQLGDKISTATSLESLESRLSEQDEIKKLG